MPAGICEVGYVSTNNRIDVHGGPKRSFKSLQLLYMMTQDVPYIKLFSSLPAVKLLFCMSPHLNILYTSSTLSRLKYLCYFSFGNTSFRTFTSVKGSNVSLLFAVL